MSLTPRPRRARPAYQDSTQKTGPKTHPGGWRGERAERNPFWGSVAGTGCRLWPERQKSTETPPGSGLGVYSKDARKASAGLKALVRVQSGTKARAPARAERGTGESSCPPKACSPPAPGQPRPICHSPLCHSTSAQTLCPAPRSLSGSGSAGPGLGSGLRLGLTLLADLKLPFPPALHHCHPGPMVTTQAPDPPNLLLLQDRRFVSQDSGLWEAAPSRPE